MKTVFKVYTILLFVISTNLVFAGDPPVPGGGGGGTTGPGGRPENPIDMYLIWLGVTAIVSIFYIVKQNKKKLA